MGGVRWGSYPSIDGHRFESLKNIVRVEPPIGGSLGTYPSIDGHRFESLKNTVRGGAANWRIVGAHIRQLTDIGSRSCK